MIKIKKTLIALSFIISHSIASENNIIKKESLAMESLAYQLRINPNFISDIEKSESKELSKIYNQIIEKYKYVFNVEDTFIQIENSCRIRMPEGSCNLQQLEYKGDNLFIIESLDGRYIDTLVISQGSPERTRIFKSNDNGSVSKVYDSYESKLRCNNSDKNQQLRFIQKINFNNGEIKFIDEGDLKSDLTRTISVKITSKDCSIVGL